MLKGGCKTENIYIELYTLLQCSITKTVRCSKMRELTQDEIDFLYEMSELNFESDYKIWIEHMEESFS